MLIFASLLAMPILVMHVSGDECSRCQPILGDPFNNMLWYFYKVHHFTCPEEGDTAVQTKCSWATDVWMNGMEEQCANNYAYIVDVEYRKKKHSDWIDKCWNKNEVIGLSALIGGPILALLFLLPVICACCCCFYKLRGKKRTYLPQDQSPQMDEEEQDRVESGFTNSTLPQPPPGYNLVPFSAIPQQQVPAGFKLIPLSELNPPQAPPPGYKLVPLH